MKHKLAPDDMAKHIVKSLITQLSEYGDDSEENVEAKALDCAKTVIRQFEDYMLYNTNDLNRIGFEHVAYWSAVKHNLIHYVS